MKISKFIVVVCYNSFIDTSTKRKGGIDMHMDHIQVEFLCSFLPPPPPPHQNWQLHINHTNLYFVGKSLSKDVNKHCKDVCT